MIKPCIRLLLITSERHERIGEKIPRESNASSSSSTLNHPSSSHPLDDFIDENDDESFHSNPSSLFQNISSSSNDVSRVHQNPPHKSHYLYTFLYETISLQTQQRDAHREGLRAWRETLILGEIPKISSHSYCPNSQKIMDSQYPTLAKIHVLDTGKFEQWQFRIQQYLQLEHYALWEVVEFGDSYKKILILVFNKLRDQAYENSLIYKERTKKLHDDKIKNSIFNVGDQVLLFNSRLKIFSGKLKSCWSGLLTIAEIYPYDTAKLIHSDGCNFKVNCHRLKHYHGGDLPPLEIPDVTTFPKDN
nr:reverse transcriptase domain-containing protein [Tanacetum cinerariifolium]